MSNDPLDAGGECSNIFEPGTVYDLSLSGIILSMAGYTVKKTHM